MQSFSIRNIELLTGIKAHTLRMWEQRYDFFKAQRKESKQRIYSNEDLQKLLCISFLYHNGWKVSRIATLSDDEIFRQVESVSLGETNHQTYIQRLLQAAVDFNEASFLKLLNTLIEGIGMEKTMVQVCYPYLQRLGLLWNANKVIPAQEHFSSYLIQNRLISETERFSAQQNRPPEIVLFCPENEEHELPLLFLNYLFRKNGWSVFYLGKNIAIPDLAEAAKLPDVRFLYLHLITNFTGIFIDDYLEKLRKAFPAHIVVASGPALAQSQRRFVNTLLLKNDDAIYRFVANGRTTATAVAAQH